MAIDAIQLGVDEWKQTPLSEVKNACELCLATGTLPGAIGKLMPSKVSEPVPKGKLQLFVTDASPEQCKS